MPSAARRQKPPATPTPMPALAPVDKPVDAWVAVGVVDVVANDVEVTALVNVDEVYAELGAAEDVAGAGLEASGVV